jgi:hypothetical protein
MLGRRFSEESGVAMGLAVIMIVLVGVMGAGLLVFVRNDLQSVVEVNQGQRAMNLADAGVQAAKRQLRADAEPLHYDTTTAANVEWAYVRPSGDPKTLSLGEGTATVTIRYLLPCVSPCDLEDPDYAPEPVPTDPPGLTDYPGDKHYFKIVSEGVADRARRKVEAIFYTSKLDVPTAYYTPKTIDFRGSVSISGVSFFARENIVKSGSSVDIDRDTPAIYGDWDTTNFNPPSGRNTVGRTDNTGQPVVAAGLAAEGTVEEMDSSDPRKGIYDYDSTTNPPAEKFCRKPAPTPSPPCSTTVAPGDPNPPGTISYPFNPEAEPDLDFLREEAQRQGYYYPTRTPINNSAYPNGSTDQTVFYVNGQGGDVSLDTTASEAARGTIVVENGNVVMTGSASFKGVIIITGNGTTTGLYRSSGSPELEGFVLADGNMRITGSVTPFAVTEEFTTRPGFYAVRLWSWRECYNVACS